MPDYNLYIGCIVVKATKMTEQEFMGPISKNLADKGFHNTNIVDVPGYLIVQGNGAKIWKDAKYFEDNFRKVTEDEAKLVK